MWANVSKNVRVRTVGLLKTQYPIKFTRKLEEVARINIFITLEIK